MTPLITNDAIVFGILMAILGFVFVTSHSEVPLWKKFYTYIPPLLLCYFVPSIFSSIGLYSGDVSKLYTIASQYLLPTSLVLLTISIDLKAIARLGPKAIIMFLGGTVGIIIGGPLAVLIVSFINPELVGGQGPEAVWRGLATIAGSWIGGSANQTAMKEVYEVGDRLFSVMIAIDVLVANVWMACLLFAAGRAKQIDRRVGADTSAIDEVKTQVEEFRARIAKIPALKDTISVLAVGFMVTAVSHLGADLIAPRIERHAPSLAQFSLTSKFFWIVVLATTGGLLLSLSARVRALEGVGASTLGSVLLYVLIATIGMKMNIFAVFDQPGLFLVGGIWMAFHGVTMLLLAWLIKAPLFFLAVGSQANVGGAASAPVVASAFHPALAPVGVLLAVLGYALGTYGGWLSGQLMRVVAPQ
jgi:uncharacterized membrane protein